MRYILKHSGQNFILFVFLYFAMICAMFQNIAGNIFFLYFAQTKKLEFLPAMFRNIAHSMAKQTAIKRLYFFFVFLYFAMLYAMFQNIESKFHFLCISLFCYAIRYVSKHSGQNFIFFVFLYFAVLCAMFQNIAVKISFSLYFFISLCYALCFKT